MCKDLECKINNEIRICKTCGETKPIKEFNSKGKGYHNSNCRVCECIIKRNLDYTLINWTVKEDRILLDFVLNKREKYLNNLTNILNKDIKSICNRISVDFRSHTKLMVKETCDNCGKEIILKPHHILSSDSHFCSKSCNYEFKGWTYIKVKEFIETKISGNGCILLSQEQNFINTYNKLEIKCKCGEPFFASFDQFKAQNKKQCNSCSMKSKALFFRKTTKQFNNELINKFGENEYIVLGRYIGKEIPILIRHKCGNIWSPRPADLLSANKESPRCPQCCKLIDGYAGRKTIEKFKQEVYDLVGNEYTVIGEYKTNHIKILMKHNCIKCNNHEWSVEPNSILQGSGCPVCSESRGETKIRKHLLKYNFNFIPQKEFAGLVGIHNGNLSYDFYLEKYNLLIEFQGEQHERYIEGFHKSIKDFEKQVEHDKRKKEYADYHNIKLLEIWYYDFINVEKILNKELNIKINILNLIEVDCNQNNFTI